MSPTDTTGPEEVGRPRWRRVTSHPLFHLAAAFLVLALVQTFVVRLYQVPSGSMEPTLAVGDRILTSRVAYVGSSPATGDVVVFHKPVSWATPPGRGALRTAVGWFGDVFGIGPSNHEALTKRVIAGPGQSIRCCDDDGRVVVDGNPLPEPYVVNDLPFIAGQLDCASEPASSRCFPETDVPTDSYVMLGDNRSNSADSAVGCRVPAPSQECLRFVSAGDLVGKVVTVVWPFDRAFAPLEPAR